MTQKRKLLNSKIKFSLQYVVGEDLISTLLSVPYMEAFNGEKFVMEALNRKKCCNKTKIKGKKIEKKMLQ